MYKGQLKGFPKEIVEKMLERQEEQGNKRDVAIFERDKWRDKRQGAFDWDKTQEKFDFWCDVIELENFDLFYKKYPKK